MILLHISDTIESPTQNSRNFNHMIHDRTESERAPKDRKSRLPLLYRSPQGCRCFTGLRKSRRCGLNLPGFDVFTCFTKKMLYTDTVIRKQLDFPCRCCGESWFFIFNRQKRNCAPAFSNRHLRKSVLHGNCMNIQTASAPRTSNIHSRYGKAFAKTVNSLRSDSTVFAHSISFVHEEVLRLVQIV